MKVLLVIPNDKKAKMTLCCSGKYTQTKTAQYFVYYGYYLILRHEDGKEVSPEQKNGKNGCCKYDICRTYE